jgi:hypothetical protein
LLGVRWLKMRSGGLFVGTVLVLTVLGNATAAQGATRQPLYRTLDEAEHYLRYPLRTWDHSSLGMTQLRSAFCISGQSALPKANKHYPQDRLNDSGAHIYRTFAFTLNAEVKGPGKVKGHSEVYGLYLVTTRTGWRVTALR